MCQASKDLDSSDHLFDSSSWSRICCIKQAHSSEETVSTVGRVGRGGVSERREQLVPLHGVVGMRCVVSEPSAGSSEWAGLPGCTK